MALPQSRFEELASVDRIWHLRRTGLMEGLSLPDLRAIVSVCKDQIYPKGEVLFDQGDPAETLFILNRGCVRISVVSFDDREKIVGIHTSGILGESILGSSEVFEVRATAHEESWVSTISREQLMGLARQRSSIALNYASILSQRLLEARKDLESHSFLNTERRLGRTLLKLARQHGKPVFGDEDFTKLSITVSHEQLAQLVGGNRPHVSLIMSKFKKKSWIGYQGRKLLIRLSALEGLIPSAAGTH